MKCQNCNADLRLRAEFCPQCGQRVIVDFDEVAQSVHEDAAVRRGQKLEAALRWSVLAVLIAGTVLYGLIYIFNKPLRFEGAGIPSITAAGVSSVDANQTLAKPYVEPRPAPPVKTQALRVFGYRREPIRGKLLAINKGDIGQGLTPEMAVDRGLHFLKNNQNLDGSWPVAVLPRAWPQWNTGDFQWGKPGVSALALLAFFGEGYTWLPEDNGKPNPFSDNILRGVRYLLSIQNPETGRFGEGEADRIHFMYNQAMATQALAEAAGLSGDEHIKAAAQKGVDMIAASQTNGGGWNYFGHKTGDDDTSVSAWQVQALVSASEAGLNVPTQTLEKALQMYQRATQEGRVLYRLQNDDKRDTISLDAVALMCRQLMGEEPSATTLKALALKVQDAWPPIKRGWAHWSPGSSNRKDEDRAKYDPYMIYFATYGMFFTGGKGWDLWNEAMKKSVIEMQDGDGGWHCNDLNTEKAGTIYATALGVMTLQVYYRTIHPWALPRQSGQPGDKDAE